MKLATLEKIVSIHPIEQADNIELVEVLGWNVIVKKNQFIPSDWCIYVPIDTVINKSIKGFENFTSTRIKTRLIRGVWSQGIVLGIGELDENIQAQINSNLVEGVDLSELLSITKYEKIDEFVSNSSKSKNSKEFPTHILSKTDEDNLRTKNKCLDEFDSLEIYISKKMDGSSLTIIYDSDSLVRVCSRNLDITNDLINPMCQYVHNTGLDKLDIRSIAIQGEFCGPKINSNRLELKSYEFYIFNIKNLETGNYYGLDQLKEFVQIHGIELVPILDQLFYDKSIHTIQWFQDFANSITYQKSKPGEGIVIRPINPVYSPTLQKNLSCKVINQLYKD